YLKPPARPSPPLPSAAYVGTYNNAYYGAIEVRKKGGALLLLMGPKKTSFPLRHWDRDVSPAGAPTDAQAVDRPSLPQDFHHDQAGRARPLWVPSTGASSCLRRMGKKELEYLILRQEAPSCLPVRRPITGRRTGRQRDGRHSLRTSPAW